MGENAKTSQLQIRVSAAQKAEIQARARRAGISMSEWVLSRLLPSSRRQLEALLSAIRSDERDRSLSYAELIDWIDAATPTDVSQAIAEPCEFPNDPYWANYLAATFEQAAVRKGFRRPEWLMKIPPLEAPAFGSSLGSLRLHLLICSPPPFAARNLFVDTTLGGRV